MIEGPSLDVGETYTPVTIQAGPHGSLTGASIVAPDGHLKCHRFLQIPYAHPPTGENRWRPPKALPEDYRWDDVKADDFGNITAQPTYSIKGPDGSTFPTVVAGRELSEDALTVNVWTPVGEPPREGWPVIIVAVAYRLSLFGFLASKEIAAENVDGCAGNFGFMDQRLGLEWAFQNVQHFGGNPSNITLGGPSAGSYSTQFQLAYEFNFPEKAQPIIKRVIQYSNAVPAQPKSVEESQAAFDGLLETLGISLDLDSETKMSQLRAISTEDLMKVIMRLKIHTFRAVSDGVFVHKDMLERVHNGHYASHFKERDMAMIIGEVEEEELLYSVTNPPASLGDLTVQLNNYYPVSQVSKIEQLYGVPSTCDPDSESDMAALRTLYGKMVADGQVYVPSRGLVNSLFEHGVGMDKILRYRISWKPKGAGRISIFNPQVTHSDDTWSWWYSKRYGFTENDCQIAQEWIKPWYLFLSGDVPQAAQVWWGKEGTPTTPRKQRALKSTTEIGVIEDDRWDRCMGIAETVKV
ncbi:hypothetical protein CI109_101361 [Kwoniella shandongensis]|uniref:Carboxylic ester hydrolase n=1 Tax=Kwoniella shandongensis TaxID=1734106 RepID=A0AAJ8LHK9_9TREE